MYQSNVNDKVLLLNSLSKLILRGQTIPLAVRWVCGRLLAGITDSNPAGAWISVSCDCCMLSGRGLCFGLTTCPEDFYRM